MDIQKISDGGGIKLKISGTVQPGRSVQLNMFRLSGGDMPAPPPPPQSPPYYPRNVVADGNGYAEHITGVLPNDTYSITVIAAVGQLEIATVVIP